MKVTRIVDAAKRRAPAARQGGRRPHRRRVPGRCRRAAARAPRPPRVVRARRPRARLAPSTRCARRSSRWSTPRAGIRRRAASPGCASRRWACAAAEELVRLDLEMSIAAPDPHDRIVIDGDPPLDVLVRGGTHGDRGTVGTVLSAIPAVVAATPGPQDRARPRARWRLETRARPGRPGSSAGGRRSSSRTARRHPGRGMFAPPPRRTTMVRARQNLVGLVAALCGLSAGPAAGGAAPAPARSARRRCWRSCRGTTGYVSLSVGLQPDGAARRPIAAWRPT